MSSLIIEYGYDFLKKGFLKAAGEAGIPDVGIAFTVTEFLKKGLDELDKEKCARVRKLLNCDHVDVCPKGWTTEINDRLEYCSERKGCAFRYDGVALCHFQADFDVKKVTTDVIRYNRRTHLIIMGNGDMPLRPCEICSAG